jgi:integrase
VATRVFNLHQAAGILIRGGLDPAELTSLRDLVQPVERVAEVLDFLCGRTRRALDDGEAVGGQVAQVAETLRQVAEHHVGLGGEDLERIRGWARETRPSRAERGMSALSRERLRAMIQDRPRALLVNLPEELMRRARAARAEDPTGAARLALSAVALEILLVCPLRAENLRGLRLDRHLQRLGHRGRLVTHVVLQPAETKTREPLEWPLPRPSAELLEEFVRSFRPVIAAPDNPHLLPGAGPGARSGTALAAAVTGTIERLIGIRVHLHLLRHFAAWLHLRAHPGAYEDVRRVLGHRDIQTTIRFYVAFEATAAAERFDAAVLRERHATRAVAAKAWSGRVPRRGARL